MPVSRDSIIQYLSSGIFEGIGAITAHRIVDEFGEDTMNVIQSAPEKLSTIKGISREKAIRIGQAYQEQYALGNLSLFLQPFGIGAGLIGRIYKHYGDSAVSAIQDNPYRLADEISGIGFKTSDLIASKLGIEADSKERLCAGIKYVLLNEYTNGNVYLPESLLLEKTAVLLNTNADKLTEPLFQLTIRNEIVSEKSENGNNIYLMYQYKYERYVAKRLLELLECSAGSEISDLDKRIENFQKHENIDLDEKQRLAVEKALNSYVMLITGGPGTGKTTIMKCIISIYTEEGYSVAVIAPTGRAAKRITESTGYEARTIHRFLELSYSLEEEEGREPIFGKNMDNPIEEDVVIVDETSMVDINIMYSLISAIKDGTRIIFAGDADQLPSVGPGKVLKDMIDSECIPTVRLTDIYRQAEHSNIIKNAHLINVGKMPVLNEKDSDFYFMKRENPHDVAKLIAELSIYRLPKKYGFDSLNDIQVLTPMRKGITGVENLNFLLQCCLNAPSQEKHEKQLKNMILREGDKVMQVKNNYNLRWEKTYDSNNEGYGIYNGDMGTIREVNNEFRFISVEFDDNRLVKYDYTMFDELEHAFAITIHKSQGSEYDAIIIPVCPGPPMLLNRNLLYTAVTRAKKLAVLVGSMSVLERMILNTNEQKRFSGLMDKLKILSI